MLDNRTESLITFARDDDGAWKIRLMRPLKYEILTSEERLTAKADVDPAVEKALLEVLERNVTAMDNEDYEAALATIDLDSPRYSQIERMTDVQVSGYDIDLEIEVANVLGATDHEAYIYVVETGKNLSGLDYEDFRSRVVNALRKQEDGSWKFYMTYLISSEPLE
jgi:ketosteroid isomerase-like protein